MSKDYYRKEYARWDSALSKYVIIDGGRRFEASTRLSLDEVPCWIQQGDRDETLIDQIVHNWQRADLHPYEIADALARLRDEHGLNQQQMAKQTGKSKGEISKLLALHDNVSPEVQEIARNAAKGAELTKRHLYSISKLNPSKQSEVADMVQQNQMTAVETEKHVANLQKKVEVSQRGGIRERQLRHSTSKADVLITFRRKGFTAQDVIGVLREVLEAMMAV